MNQIDKLFDSIKEISKEKTKAYDTQATVTRVDGGTVYVHIPGGVDETPIDKTVSAKPGDVVQVRVANGKAWATGNATAPPTDDSAALRAEAEAARANQAASSATQSAQLASESAADAQEKATTASTAAATALTKAEEAEDSAEQAATAAATADQKATAAGAAAAAAQSSADAAASAAATADSKADAASAAATRAETKADTASAAASRAETSASAAETAAASAQTSADGALVGLSTVQDVVGVLNWITAHGTMTSQSGGTFDDNQVYFIQDNNGDYTVGGVRYSLVAEPKASDINTYYVLSVDESVQNYVATHIVVDSEGLWIIPDAGGNKVLIATGNGSSYTTAGTYIINGSTVLASFLASGATVGKATEGNVKVTSTGLDLCYGSNVIGTITTNGLEFNGRDFDNNLMTFLKILSDDTFIKSNKYITESGGEILKYKQTTELSTDGFSIKKNRGTSTLTAMEITDTGIKLDGTEDDNQSYHQGGSVYLSTEDGDGVVVGKWTNGNWSEKARIDNGGYIYAAENIGSDGNITAQGDVIDGSGNVLADKASQQVWYGTSSTSASTATKIVRTTTGDFDFKAGNVLYVRFTQGNTSSVSLYVTVDGTQKQVYFGNVRTGAYYWGAYETLALVYSGSYFYAVNQGIASTDYYGATKLEDSVTSTSTDTSATPNSVKQAYDRTLTRYKETITSYSSGWSYYDNNTNNQPVIRASGNVVNLQGVLTNTASKTLNITGIMVFSIPSAYAPTRPTYAVCHGSGTNKFLLQVNNNGEVTFSRYTNATSYSAISSGAWFPFNLTWIIDD